MKKLSVSAALAITLLLAACSPDHSEYSRFENVGEGGWMYRDTLTFAVDSLLRDPVLYGGMKIAVRHENDYPYANLWMEVSYVDGAGSQRRDTVNMNLADIYGRWLGKGFGSGYQMEARLPQPAGVDMRRPVTVRHIMRLDTVRGINCVGITVTPAEVNKR